MTQPAQYISGRTVQEQMDQLIGYVDTRAAEVATDAIASDVAQVHQDMLDADADASAAAASAAAAAGTLANAVKKTGEASQSIAGDIDVSGDLSAGGDLAVAGSVNAAGAALTGNVTVPDTAAESADAKAVNGTRLQADLAAYAPMIRTTGNFTRSGDITQPINASASAAGAVPVGYLLKAQNIDTSQPLTSGNKYAFMPALVDANGKIILGFRVQVASSGGGHILVSMATTATNGTVVMKTLGDFNQATGVWS